jgi:hypothetical protein
MRVRHVHEKSYSVCIFLLIKSWEVVKSEHKTAFMHAGTVHNFTVEKKWMSLTICLGMLSVMHVVYSTVYCMQVQGDKNP